MTEPAESWRDHVEQMLRTWRCSHLNEDGDRLALDDFMDQESIEDLIDFVCDEWAAPAPVALTDEERQVRNLLAVIHRDGGHYAVEHGIAKACVDAIQAWYAPSDDVSRLTAERDALREVLKNARAFVVDARPDGGGMITIGYDAMVNEIDAALEATK